MMMSYVWIKCLVVTSQILGSLSELCVYTYSSKDVWNLNKTQTSRTEECQWGCCSSTMSPCCSVPISLLVGVILGGVVLVAALTAVICYYCVYRRADICMNVLRSFQTRQAATDSRTRDGNTTFQAESSGENALPTYPEYSDPPPSYEEVMKGHTNSAYNPDELDRGSSPGI